MRQATEATPLWHATTEAFGRTMTEPPFWAFAWAGGVALARYILDHPHVARDLRVVDIASGGGIVAIACARAGAKHVNAVDSDALAGVAARINSDAAGVIIETTERLVDATYAPTCDLIVAGDVFYDRVMSEQISAFFVAARTRGTRILCGDPNRMYAPKTGVRELAVYEVPTLMELESVATKTVRVLELI